MGRKQNIWVLTIVLLFLPVVSSFADTEKSDHPELLFQQAQSLLEKGETDAAIIKLKQTINADLTYFSAYWLLLNAYISSDTENEDESSSTLVVSGEYYENALIYLEDDNAKSAIIELRNAIKSDPNNLPAYLKLAETYLALRQSSAAESVLMEAEKNGVEKKLIIKLLAQSYLDQKKYRQLLDKITTVDLSSQAKKQIQLLWVSAHMGLRQYDKAEKLLKILMKSEPGWVEGHIELAKLRLAQSKIEAVEEELSKVLTKGHNNADYWQLKGELEKRLGNWTKAISHYSQAIEIDPKHLISLQDRASLSLDLNLLEQVKQDVTVIRKDYPYDLRGMLLEAMYLKASGDESAAQLVVNEAITLIEKADYLKIRSDPYMLALVASIHRFSGNYKEAEALLERYLELLPNSAEAFRLLGDIQLKLNQPEKSVDSLNQSLLLQNDDIRTTQLLVMAYTKLAAYKEAEDLLSQMLFNFPKNRQLRIQQAEVKLAQGKKSEAIEIYKYLVDQDKSDFSVQLSLANIYLMYGDFDQAAVIADNLLAKQLDNPTYHHLIGTIKVGQKQFDAGRLAFSKAVELSSVFTPSILNLALLDLQAGDLATAKKRYSRVIEIDPKHVVAMRQLAFIAEKNADNAKAMFWLEKSLDIDLDIDTGLGLVDKYVSAGNSHGAELMIKRLIGNYPNNLRLHSVSAAWSLNNGNPAKAKRDYIRMTRLASEQKDVEWLLKIVDFQLAIRDIESAKKTIKAAALIDENSVHVISAQISILMSESNFEQARVLAENLIQLASDKARGYQFLGDALIRLGRSEDALKWYKKGLEKTPGSSQMAVSNYKLMRQFFSQKQAVVFLEGWVTSQTQQDLFALQVLAAGHAELGNTQKAIDINEKLLKLQKNDPYILNNLAYLYWAVADKRAQSFAERAYEIAPDSPAILDTLGWILTQVGDHARGLQMLRNAVARSANNAEIRYHYAVALHKTGKDQSAIRELKVVVSADQSFKDLDDAKKLLQSLLD